MAPGPKNLEASRESGDGEETPLGLDVLLVLTLPVPAQIPVLLFPSHPRDHAAPTGRTGQDSWERHRELSRAKSDTPGGEPGLCSKAGFPHALKSTGPGRVLPPGRGSQGNSTSTELPKAPNLNGGHKLHLRHCPNHQTTSFLFLPAPRGAGGICRSSLDAAPLPGMSFESLQSTSVLRQNPPAKASGPKFEISGTSRY